VGKESLYVRGIEVGMDRRPWTHFGGWAVGSLGVLR
jgi:hypothetical protein